MKNPFIVLIAGFVLVLSGVGIIATAIAQQPETVTVTVTETKMVGPGVPFVNGLAKITDLEISIEKATCEIHELDDQSSMNDSLISSYYGQVAVATGESVEARKLLNDSDTEYRAEALVDSANKRLDEIHHEYSSRGYSAGC